MTVMTLDSCFSINIMVVNKTLGGKQCIFWYDFTLNGAAVARAECRHCCGEVHNFVLCQNCYQE